METFAAVSAPAPLPRRRSSLRSLFTFQRSRSFSRSLSFTGGRSNRSSTARPTVAVVGGATAPPLSREASDASSAAAANATHLREVVINLTMPENDDAQNVAVRRLAMLIDDASPEDAKILGEFVRDYGALEALLVLLDRPASEQDALRVIGNLASNAVDPNAADTKRLLFELGAFERILRRIHSDNGPTVVYALGSVQNMCARRDFALHMQETGADVRLRQLLNSSSNASARNFANGCLSNMEAVLSPTFIEDPRLVPRSSSTNSSMPSSPRPSSMPASPRTPARTPEFVVQVPQQPPPPMPPPSPHPPRLREDPNPRNASPPRGAAPGTAAPVADAPPGNRPVGRDGMPVCAVCLDNPVNTALTPCFHAGFCNSCAVTISYNRFPCPICRAPVTGLQRIYL